MLEREFGVPREHTEECSKLITENGRFVGLIHEVSGSPYVVFGETTAPLPSPESLLSETKKIESQATSESTKADALQKQIFVAHGRSKVPLEQLKKILDQFNIPYKVAVEEPHQGRPISAKVSELMRNCSSAIFIFTADEEIKESASGQTFRPSENVIYELGAASVLYGNRIVLFKEEGVDFGSDFRDFGYITFQKENIEAKSMELFKELIALGFLKVTPV